MKFYLGTHIPSWLWSNQEARWPWFVSRRRLARLKSYRPANGPWALDSGGFTEIAKYGEWRVSAADYVKEVRRYSDEIGQMEWAAPQDWMCEPSMLESSGLTVADHQKLTVENFLELRHIAADLPIVPGLQGWSPFDYLDHVEQYTAAGVDLAAEPIVGVGSVCRRADLDPIASLFARLESMGISMHGFGIKADGVSKYGHLLASSDSLAWSFAGRYRGCGQEHRAVNCANCRAWAEMWAERTTSRIGCSDVQMSLL